jgi:hypothetical protein
MKLVTALTVVLSLQVSGGKTRLEVVDRNQTQHVFPRAAGINYFDCSFAASKAVLGIDLRFHTGFSVALPLNRLLGDARAIRVVLRVTPLSAPDRQVFFSMLAAVPALDRDAKGNVELSGEYVVGPGRYAVDYVVSLGDVACRDQWRIEAKTKGPFDRIPLAIAADSAAELPSDPFDDPGRSAPRPSRSMYAKVLVNFAPAGVDSTILDSEDVRVIAAILRSVSHEPRFGRFSVVAFSSDQERVLHRQGIASKIDFGALGRALRGLPSGVVSLRQMQDPRSTTRFLENLLAEELRPAEEPPDAVVVISPKLSLDEKLADRELAERGRVPCPVFLLSYNPQPIEDPWEGALARAVKKAYRGFEYTITSPHDLGKALLRVRSELPKSR